jgi:ABC-type transport system involved in cytochrome c biogenesis permease subunit
MMRWILIFLLLGSMPAMAADMEDFRALPVLADGRVKPLETFARSELMQISGRDTAGGQPAIDWLAEVLFAPDAAAPQKIILIKPAEMVQMLGLPPAENNLYSYDEIAAAFDANKDMLSAIIQKPDADRSPLERDIAGRYGAVADYFQLLNAMTLLLPDNAALLRQHTAINQKLLQIVKVKDARVARYSTAERKVADTAYALANLEMLGAANDVFRVIPDETTWQSPWQSLLHSQNTDATARALLPWRELAKSYAMHDAAKWQTTAHELRVENDQNASAWRLRLEVWYQRINPLVWLTFGYGIAAALLGLGQKRKTIFRAGQMTALICLAAHGAMVLARMLILSRPPVSTLYESLLFVSFILMVAGSLWAGGRANFQWVNPLLAMIILITAPAVAPQGDTMGVLIAVLNTNFWLATHVVCITTGYATALLAGTAAHLSLAQKDARMEMPLKWLAVTALFFTATGTLLGGIWADQSWGRFWGWDPKENGALLIVLWLIWLLHGRMTRHMGARGFAALLAATNIIVALSWFGVNLLNVGLHSYGFTHAAAYGLAAFCGVEVMMISFLYWFSKRHAR